jgi:hypothetical protein
MGPRPAPAVVMVTCRGVLVGVAVIGMAVRVGVVVMVGMAHLFLEARAARAWVETVRPAGRQVIEGAAEIRAAQALNEGPRRSPCS